MIIDEEKFAKLVIDLANELATFKAKSDATMEVKETFIQNYVRGAVAKIVREEVAKMDAEGFFDREQEEKPQEIG